jgi:hypothetical protein
VHTVDAIGAGLAPLAQFTFSLLSVTVYIILSVTVLPVLLLCHGASSGSMVEFKKD